MKGRHVREPDGRTTRSLGLPTSQEERKQHEDVFSWCKETSGLCRPRKHGTDRIGASPLLILTSYDLVRMGSCSVVRPGTDWRPREQ